jgi:glutamine synthetase
MTVLNTIVAEAVDRIAGELEAAKVAGKAKPGEHTAAFHIALQKILQSSLKAHKRVIFNGNGYEADWPKEAEKRGLPNAPDTLSALAALSKKENIALFEKYGVMTKRELTSRREIFLEEYANKVRIEGNTALDMARTMILPAVRAEYLETAKTYNETDSSNVKIAIDMLHGQMTELGTGLVKMKEAIDYLQDALKNYDTADTLARMSELRKIADSLEAVVSNERWPLPKYREMLFLY